MSGAAPPVDLRERAEEEQVVALFAMGYNADAPHKEEAGVFDDGRARFLVQWSRR